MAARAPANLSRVQARQLGAKGKPLDSSDAIQAVAAKQHSKTKKADEDSKCKAAEQAAALPIAAYVVETTAG